MLRYLFPYLLIFSQSLHLYALASIRVLDTGVLPLEKNSVAIFFYLDIENEDRSSVCKIHPWTQRCCLTASGEDCDAIEVYGVNIDKVKPKDRKTLLYLYPTMYQHDQLGYCDFVLDYKCGTKRSKREHVHVPFDTRIEKRKPHLLKSYLNGQKETACESLDQNSLNNCEPVNCDLKYCGSKPFYDCTVNKCVEAPECETDPNKVLPDVVYVPISNVCRDLEHPLTVADIYAINAGLGIVTESTKAKENMRVVIKSHYMTISQNLKFLQDIMYGKLCVMGESTNLKQCSKSALLCILFYIVGISTLLLSFACCVNITVWLHVKWLNGELKKMFEDIKSKFKGSKRNQFGKQQSKVNKNVTHDLLKEVIVSNLPLELRDSAAGICERVENEVRMDRKYGTGDVGSQVNMYYAEDTSTDASSSDSGDNK